MRDRKIWLRHSKELIRICNLVRDDLYLDIETDAVGQIISATLLKGVRTFSAVRLLYMKQLEEQAQALVRTLFETMVDLNLFVSKCLEDPTDATTRVMDAMMLQKVQQARESKWVGFDLVGIDPKGFLAIEASIKEKYEDNEIKSMRRHGFSGLPLKEIADRVHAAEMYSIIYRNFSRNVHSTDYAEHLQMLKLKQDSKWDKFKDLRDAVGFSAAAKFTWTLAYTTTVICTHDAITSTVLLIKLERIRVKLRNINSWVSFQPDAEASGR